MGKNKKQKQKQKIHQPVERTERIEIQGVVTEALPATLFKVEINGNASILATLAGKLRQNHIRILPGDHVIVEVSQYDLTRGRIVWRGK